jgi:HEXXH motif-containing protein
VISRADIEMIAGPDGAARAIRPLVAAERSKHMLLLRAAVDGIVASQAHRRAVAAYDILAEVARRVPRAADAVICYPAVGAWALRLLRGTALAEVPAAPGWDDGTQAANGVAAIAAAAAILGRFPCRIDWPAPFGAASTVMLPSLGYAAIGDAQNDVAVLSVNADGAQISCGTSVVNIPPDPRHPGHRWHPVLVISAATSGNRFSVLLDNQNPYRLPGQIAQPDRPCAANSDAWREVLAAGWQILTRHHPAIAADVSSVIKVFTPICAPAGSQVSSTARESFGAIALSLPADDLTMAVTLAHEVQHAKLMGLEDLFPLIYPSGQDRYYAPWRDDPRPLGGLLHGAFAYLGVAGFWRRQRLCENTDARANRAHTEFARWRQAARDVADFLTRSDRLTPQGRLVVDVMARNLNQWCAEHVPAQALRAAQVAAAKHQSRWLRDHGGVG